MRRATVQFSLLYFFVRTQGNLVCAAGLCRGVCLCGHIGWTRGRGKETHGCCAVRLGFLISGDPHNLTHRIQTQYSSKDASHSVLWVHALHQQSAPSVSPMCILHNNHSFLWDVGDASGARRGHFCAIFTDVFLYLLKTVHCRHVWWSV